VARFIYVDCEADGPCPGMGVLTEFGAVEFKSQAAFHGQIYEAAPDPANPAKSRITGRLLSPPGVVFRLFEGWLTEMCGPERPVMVSDNPAFDFQWINHGFWTTLNRNPLGHSARRISDFYAGLTGDWSNTQKWKRLRVTPHDHNPVHDALGNVEAMKRILAGER
jgi:hypothetical protein